MWGSASPIAADAGDIEPWIGPSFWVVLAADSAEIRHHKICRSVTASGRLGLIQPATARHGRTYPARTYTDDLDGRGWSAGGSTLSSSRARDASLSPPGATPAVTPRCSMRTLRGSDGRCSVQMKACAMFLNWSHRNQPPDSLTGPHDDGTTRGNKPHHPHAKQSTFAHQSRTATSPENEATAPIMEAVRRARAPLQSQPDPSPAG
jgi:hypothetical protein